MNDHTAAHGMTGCSGPGSSPRGTKVCSQDRYVSSLRASMQQLKARNHPNHVTRYMVSKPCHSHKGTLSGNTGLSCRDTHSDKRRLSGQLRGTKAARPQRGYNVHSYLHRIQGHTLVCDTRGDWVAARCGGGKVDSAEGGREGRHRAQGTFRGTQLCSAS